MTHTPQQRIAIETHDRNIVLVAGAGCGKTHVLVERYLALLTANPGWRLNELVAITFTRKAASEMRDRVRRALEHSYHAEPTAPGKARWSDLLASMDSARIGTIHSLCTSILRANAAAVGLDPDFTVLDETDAAMVLDDAVDAALAELEQGDPTAPELDILRHYDLRDIRAVLRNADLLNTPLPDPPADLIDRWRGQWQALCDTVFAPHMRAFLDLTLPPRAADRILENCHAACDCLKDYQRAATPEERHAALTALSALSLQGGSSKIWGSSYALAEAKAHLKAIRDAAKTLLKQLGNPPPDELDQRVVDLLPAWVALVRRAQGRFGDAKRARNALDFGDLERLTVHLFDKHPDVAERYRSAEYKHLLVDEFQDTNANQWRIVQALTGLHNQGALFVVGDPKQSIYAFRGADVSVFSQTQAQITDEGGLQLDLSQSFRTHAPLIDWFNRLFGQLLTQDDASPARAYQVGLGTPMSAARAHPPCNDPPVEIMLIPSERGDELGAPERRRWEAYALAQRLRELVEGGRLIHDKRERTERPLRYGDVALLLRALTDVNLYEDVFRAQGIPFITIAGRGYYGRQEVHDVLSLLRALNNPADELALATALHSPLFGISDEGLYHLRHLTDEDGDRLSLWDALQAVPDRLLPADEQARVRTASRVMADLRDVSGRVTIAELIREALSLTGYLATLTGLPDGAQRRGNVEKLLSKAHHAGRTTLSAFDYYLQDLTARETREGDAPLEIGDVVQIMSVHKSKGLEFPVVVLPDASRRPPGDRPSVFTVDGDGDYACRVMDEAGRLAEPFAARRRRPISEGRHDAEDRRLLYVAATRAQDMLIISGQYKPISERTPADRADGWLGWLLNAIAPDDPLVRWHRLDQPPPASAYARHINARRGWQSPSICDGLPVPGVSAHPPSLLRPLAVRRADQARHLTATSMIDIGGAEVAADEDERRYHRGRFRRVVLSDAPGVIARVTPPEGADAPRLAPRVVGEVVHKALQFGQYPTGDSRHDERLRQVLAGYAWDEGITRQVEVAQAVDTAFRDLQRFIRTPLFAAIRRADENGDALREIPFIFERDSHIIHGIIDLAYCDEAGLWNIVDYKTSRLRYVGKGDDLHDRLAQHAQRYHLQVGVYAEALRAQLGLGAPPTVKIHYIRYQHTVDVPAELWQAAVNRNLGERIAALVEDR